jgi:hypothetical protein
LAPPQLPSGDVGPDEGFDWAGAEEGVPETERLELWLLDRGEDVELDGAADVVGGGVNWADADENEVCASPAPKAIAPQVGSGIP